MKIVHVKWRDSGSYVGWIRRDHPFSISLCESSGFLVSRDDNQTVIAASFSDDCDKYEQVHCIPNENITSYCELVSTEEETL